jgi:hypothetical protein
MNKCLTIILLEVLDIAIMIKPNKMENLTQKRNQLEQLLIEKAMNDEAFRKELIADPKGTIEKETGMKLPDNFNVKVLEENPQSFFLVLPATVQPGSEDELSEAELEMVSGGWGGVAGIDPEKSPTGISSPLSASLLM